MKISAYHSRNSLNRLGGSSGGTSAPAKGTEKNKPKPANASGGFQANSYKNLMGSLKAVLNGKRPS